VRQYWERRAVGDRARGATTAEYLGVIVVVAALVVVLGGTAIGDRLGSGIGTAICKVAGQGGCHGRCRWQGRCRRNG
jgi:Flp pilus assembly pilin Flp